MAADVLAAGVWHIGLLLVHTRLHGTGFAQRLHSGLQAWAVKNGARWLRLSVVIGNRKAERFWSRLGYVPVRTRAGIVMGRQENSVSIRVMALCGAGMDEYLSQVPRDRANAP